ncbi:DMT family transporter [Pseudotabrizicola sp. L79]|uniref:DMT family transporter n=1 Tax=Pseudotabrizicola sp. L79 TaxID=3118402 RepID=UPI002F93A33A
MQKDRLDLVGGATLVGVALLLAVNQVIVVEVNRGLQPVFFAGLRSVLAVGFVWAWLAWRGRPPVLRRKDLGAGLAIGTVFAAEFLCLFLALDLTALGRASVIFYSMPLWLALMAHFGLAGQRITRWKAAGLALAFVGTAGAILSRQAATGGSLAGDLLALGAAFGWAGTAFLARRSSLREVGAEMQLFWMVLVSGPILIVLSLAFGPWVRELSGYHILGLLFQSSIVVAGGFILWLWLLSVYPTATVASFSFLTPVFAMGFGIAMYGERVTVPMLIAALFVAAGIVLINRPPPTMPQAAIKPETEG